LKKPIQFGKYYLLDRINVGGMAEVFKAKAFGVEGFERLLAVKRILPNIAEDEEFITMFIDEAKIAVQLNHANICQIFDLGKVDDSYFIALEFVHGKDLRAIFDRCKQRPGAPGVTDGSQAMPIPQACFITMKCCEGLDYAHNKRDAQGRELHLVHRDVSPQNVLISYEGEVKLIDFGIAKAAGKASKTQQGILKGKFGYMSPEQVRGLPLDRRSDVFSLGIVLYELLTGERLFVGESDFSTLEKVRNVEILPPSTYNRRISDELERIVMKALAKDVEDRYQNAIDLHDDLQAYMYSAGEFYSRKDLAAWMKKVFAAEIEAETAKLESYQKLPPPEIARPSGVAAAAAGGAVAGERPRRTTIPPPPPSAASPRISGQHAIVSSAPPPPPVTTAPANGAAASEDGDFDWDEEELATNIYEAAQDAGDAVVDEAPDDLSNVELSADGEPVPYSAQPASSSQPHHNGRENGKVNGSPKATPAQKTMEMNAPSLPPAAAAVAAAAGIGPKAQKTVEMAPVGAAGGAAEPAVGPRPPVTSKPLPGPKTLERELFDLPLPPPPGAQSIDMPGSSLPPVGPTEMPAAATTITAKPLPLPSRPGRSPSQTSKLPLLIGGAVLVLALAGGLGAWMLLGRGPGEVVITSEPAADVQVLVDNKKVAADGTPATLKLEPGVHMITVQREGYLPKTETVEVKSGETARRRFVLEAFSAGTGFTLVSDPPGLQAIFDGQPLEGVTPLKVQAVAPGKHTIALRGKAGQSWSQEITLEAGKMLDVVANLTAPAVAVAPEAPQTKTTAPTPTPPPVEKTAKPEKASKPEKVEAKPEKVGKPEPPATKPEPVAARPEKPAKAEPEPKKPRELPRLASEELPKPAKPEKNEKPEKPAEKAVAKAEPEPKKPTGEGFLRLGSKPWTNIAIDGKDTGLHTPQTQMKLSAGPHRITLSNPQFNIKETFSVDIKPGETSTVIKDFRPSDGEQD
jgi:serine/threonine protein kinase